MAVDMDARDPQALDAAVTSYDLVGHLQDSELAAIARLAAQICDVPKATVNLLDSRQQHQIATAGFEGSSMPLSDSMCKTAVTLADPVYVSDASQDPRFADNVWVNGTLGTVRLYASSQLRTSKGLTVGTLCVFDETARQLEFGQRTALDDLAQQVVRVLELRARAAELSDSVSELTRSNADLSAFAGRVAHDLRNPIAATSGFLQLAQGAFGAELTGRARECVVHAGAAVERMSGQVEALLAYAGVGAQLTLEAVDLDLVAADAVRDLQVLIDSQDGQVTVAALGWVTTDPRLVRLLLLNLISNAVKYARLGTPPDVRVSADTSPEGWRLVVTDNGRGIRPDDRERVFELFTRLRDAADVAGSGIGLATCARIADTLRGHLEVGDAPGRGTVITLVVPNA